MIEMKTRKVLYISYDGMTDPLGQSQVLPYLSRLSRHGYQFTILSFEKKKRYEKEKNLVKNITDSTNIKWLPLSFTSTPPVLSKIYDRWKMKRFAEKLYKQERFDVVHCRSYVAAEAGLMLKRKFKTKFLFDMRGFWADEKVDNGQWDQKKKLYKLIYHYYKKKERKFLLKADGIITLTQAAKNYLLSKPEYKNLSIEVIPCCADLHQFDFNKISPEQITSLRRTLKISQTAKVITYLGSVGGWYMTHEMFSFFKMLAARQPEYMMLILTKDDPQAIKAEASALGVDDKKLIVAYSTRDQLPQFLALSNCGIFFIRNSFSKMASSPTKHGELMGVGIPVICNDIGDTGYIVNATKTGIAVNDFSESSLMSIVDQIHSLEGIDRIYIRKCAEEFFDLNKGVQKYLEVYRNLLG